MSFNQTPISIYDLIDALSSQQERAHPRRHHHHHGGHSHSGARRAFGNPYVQSPYYYTERPQTAYYRPRYYGDEEYETPYVVSGRPNQADILPGILRAFLAQGQPEDSEAEAEAEDSAEEPGSAQLEQRRDSAQGPATVPQITPETLVKALTGKSLEQADAEASAEGEREENSEADKAESSSRPEAVLSGASSPIPDPLQVSKPQVRLDMPFSPEVNVYDTTDAYVVVLALPGANSKSFKIDYHPSSHELLIKGSLDKKIDVNDKFLRISELKGGKFERSVKFPVVPRIKDEEIKATYSNGLLQIKTPKILDEDVNPQPKRRIVIEDVPDEELLFEQNPNPVAST